MVAKLLFRRLRIKRSFSGEFEDTVLYVTISLFMSLVVLWYIIDIFRLVHTHQVVYNAAEAAATSGATQAAYTVNTVLGGAGFDNGVNQGQAQSVADTTFQLEEQALNLAQVVSVDNTSLAFPASGGASYSVTVSYVPKGLFGAIDALGYIFDHAHVPPSPPTITWTETAYSKQAT